MDGIVRQLINNQTMKAIKKIALLLISFVLLASCVSVEEKKDIIAQEAYKGIIGIIVERYGDAPVQGHCLIGYMYGDAAFYYRRSDFSLKVEYAVPGSSIYTEIGDLEDLHISEECGLAESEKYYPVSIRGRWNNRDFAGSGGFTMTLSKSNSLSVFIFGDGNWKHWQSYQLSQEQFEKILAMFNSARQKIAALDGTVCEDIKMDILREKADDGLAKEIFGAGYDYECDEEYDGQQQLLKKYGYFYFVENGKLGLADKSGHTIIEPEYSRIEISENGQYLKVVQNGLNGIMTIAGEEVIPMVYSEILPLDWNNYGKGLAYDFFGTDDPFVLLAKEERFGVADNKGNLLADVKYEHIWGCDKIVGFADGGVDLIDYESRNIVHFNCEAVEPSFNCEECNPEYKDFYCCVKMAGKWGLINSKGDLVIDAVYDEIPDQSEYDAFSLFCGGNKDIIVVKDGKYGIADLTGKEMLPCEYDYIDWMIGDNKALFMGAYDHTWRTFDGKWGLYQDGEVVRPCEYSREKIDSVVFNY